MNEKILGLKTGCVRHKCLAQLFLKHNFSVPLLAGMIHTDSPKRKLIFCTKIVMLLHHNLVLKAIIVTVGA